MLKQYGFFVTKLCPSCKTGRQFFDAGKFNALELSTGSDCLKSRNSSAEVQAAIQAGP
jgi:hypothetical protein